MQTDEILNQLLSVLNQETELYRLMLTMIEKEKTAAIESELSALIETGLEKENILLKLRQFEEQRSLLVTKLSESLQYPHENLTLTMISQMVDEPFAGRLKQAGAGLLKMLITLREANNRNKRLFEHSLELVRGSFNLMSELMTPNTTYHRTGNIQGTNPTGKCVCSEI